MADAGVVRDGNRLPWLEPYRSPKRTKKSNRRPGAAAAIGAIGLAGIVTFLMRDRHCFDRRTALPQASVVCRPGREQQNYYSALEIHEQGLPLHQYGAFATPRRCHSVVQAADKGFHRAAYRTVVKEKAGEATAPKSWLGTAIAIAALRAVETDGTARQ